MFCGSQNTDESFDKQQCDENIEDHACNSGIQHGNEIIKSMQANGNQKSHPEIKAGFARFPVGFIPFGFSKIIPHEYGKGCMSRD